MRLTNKFATELRPSKRVHSYSDYVIPRLMLTIQLNGEKLWHLRVEMPIGETSVAIGQFPDLDVSGAREKAHQILERSKEIDGLTTVIAKEKIDRANTQSEIVLSKIIKTRDKSIFRPNPMFQNHKKGLPHASEVRLEEQAKRDLLLKFQQREAIAGAWQKYKKNHDISVFLPLLRNGYFASNPMPNEMAEELAQFLERVVPGTINKDDNHIFLTYWRHTEFKNGVQPLLMDIDAVEECVAFMEAIGREIDHDTIIFRLKEAYQDWRAKNAEKLKKSGKILKDLKSQVDNNEVSSDTKVD